MLKWNGHRGGFFAAMKKAGAIPASGFRLRTPFCYGLLRTSAILILNGSV